MATNLEQFKSLLRDLFQFDAADLDFGIYRILNQKRDEIERFIQEDLVEEIDNQLATLQAQDIAQVEEEYSGVRDEVISTFGRQALENGALQDYHETPLGQRYQEKYEAYEQSQAAAEAEELTERRIYDDLYRFFRRYYDKGDFITKRRFSSGDSKYYVPYDGEEVMLYWANRDQYYIKTSERFTDYRFTADDYHVHFKLVNANTPTDNTKGDTRYFVPFGESPATVDTDEKRVTIRFEYRPISEDKEEQYLAIYNALPGKTYKTLSRSRLCEALATTLLDEVDAQDAQTALAREDKQSEKSILLKHLNRYTARNSTDYFVHKDLGGFLRGQLDFFIKNEILQLEDVLGETSGQALQQARVHADVVKSIGERIIDFLAQIEDFQKRLFEKKKFVVQTDYCITVDQVPQKLYPEILGNDEQLQEWEELYATDQWGQTLEWSGTFDEAFLQTHPYVMVDTAHFDQAFKDELLASLDDIHIATDGLLIQGENYQALNLLRAKYREKVRCVYIDPPYNTGTDGFPYKDNFQHSSWLSMMHDRLNVTATVLSENGVLYSSIDENESNHLEQLMSRVFGRNNRVEDIIWAQNTTDNKAPTYATTHEYVKVFAKNKSSVERLRPMFREPKPGYTEIMELVDELEEDYPPTEEVESSIKNLMDQHLREFKNELKDQGLEYDAETKKMDPWKGVYNYKYAEYRDSDWNVVPEERASEVNATLCVYRESDISAPATKQAESTKDPDSENYRYYRPKHPVTGERVPHPKRGWAYPEKPIPGRVSFEELDEQGRIVWGEDESKIPQYKRLLSDVETNVAKSVIQDYTDGEKQLSRHKKEHQS